MHLIILTPEKKYFDGEVSMVQVPGSEEKGAFELLNNHAPIVSAIQAGDVRVKTASGEQSFTIKSGFLEAANNTISLLVEGVEA